MKVLSFLLYGLVSSTTAFSNGLDRRDLSVGPAVKQACNELSGLFANEIFFPNSTDYKTEIIKVWDKRCDLIPACVFRPENADGVAAAMQIFHKNNAQFAVRGGGHMNYPGSNNINDGVLLVLSGLNELKLASDNASIAVGPGNRWVDVYAALAPYDLYTIGGRLKTIGVPGLALLGGVSYFANKYGFTMDNVLSYDVVLGNGTQVVASESSNSDLFWALKGSASNYGIVTSFQLKTLKVPLVSTTIQAFDGSHSSEFITAACDMVLSDDGSVAAGAVINFSYNTTTESANALVFGMEETTVSPPPRFDNFTAIPALTRVHNVSKPIVFHSQFDAPLQMFRIAFAHHTIKPDAEQLISLYAMWKDAIADIADVKGLLPTFVLNLVPRTSNSVAKNNGIGNTFGLDDSESYIWFQLATSWSRPEDDLKVTAWSESLMEYMHSLNKEQGLATEFIYMGDAGEYQRAFDGRPSAIVTRMKEIRDQYDPDLVFTKLNWGGFKLGY